MSHKSNRGIQFFKSYPKEVRIQLCKNRIKALENEIKKKQETIKELKKYIDSFSRFSKGF